NLCWSNDTLIRYIMMLKLSLLLLFVFCGQANAVVHAQHIKLTLKNGSMKDAFSSISKQSGHHFLYLEDDIRNQKITIDLNGVDLNEALDATFENTNLEYVIRGKRIIVERKTTKSLAAAPKLLSEQQSEVRGRVTESDGSPLAGVTVQNLQGGSTSTNEAGEFTLPAKQGDVLVVSFLGYEPQHITVTASREYNVALTVAMDDLDEVVVVGYGRQKRETITGSVVAVKGEELRQSPALNVSNAIAGRVPGVIATNASAEPGYDSSNIKIRGSNTLGDSGPLIVIDGIPARQGGFDRLNPADIDNISILKDASAAIYGARAANGVILVATNRGSSGKPKLSYNYNQSIAQPTVIPKLTDATQYAELRNALAIFKLPVSEWQRTLEGFNTVGYFEQPNGILIKAPFTPEDKELFRNGSDPWGHPNTDWYAATLKNWSPQQKHNLQIDGGAENMRYLLSLGYQTQDGYYKNSATGYNKYDFRIKLDANTNEYIKTQFGVLGRQEERNFPTKGSGTIFRMLMRGNPTLPAYWPNGLPGPDIEHGENPVVITTNQTGYNRDKRYYMQTNGQMDITNPWIDGLKLTFNAAVDKYFRKLKNWTIPWYLYTWQGAYENDGTTPRLEKGKRGPAEPNLNQSDEDQLNILLGAILNYEKSFQNHNTSFLIGVNRETIRNDYFSAYRRYFLSDNIDYLFAGGDA